MLLRWGAVAFIFVRALPAAAADASAPPAYSSATVNAPDPPAQPAPAAVVPQPLPLPPAPTAAPPPQAWSDSADGSFVSTTGNNKRSTASIRNTYDYSWGHYQLEIIGSALGAQSGGLAVSEEYNASEKIKYAIGDVNLLYEKFTWDKNRFVGIINRYDASVGLGRRLVNGRNDKIDVEVGGGELNEERIDAPRNYYVSGRLYAKYTHVLGATWNFSQDVEYLGDIGDAPAYQLNTETDLTSAISTHFSLRLSYFTKRANQPVPGFDKTDTGTSAALTFNY